MDVPRAAYLGLFPEGTQAAFSLFAHDLRSRSNGRGHTSRQYAPRIHRSAHKLFADVDGHRRWLRTTSQYPSQFPLH